MRGTPSAYEKLLQKDTDTLYFIAEADGSEATLYLGNQMIAGSSDSPGIAQISLDDLTDVLIDLNLEDESFLVYDGSIQSWVNKSRNELVFTGPTTLSDGVAGLVPAPSQNGGNCFLRGDGTWAPIQSDDVVGRTPAVYSGTAQEDETDADVIERLVGDSILYSGDIAIIIEDTDRRPYSYNGSEWILLTPEVISAESVFYGVYKLDSFLTSLLSDNETLETILNGEYPVLKLKNWGIQYYRYIPATETEDASYELQIVDEEHPWKEGLEPKVGPDGVLSWYEPNSAAIDSLGDRLDVVENAIANLQPVSEKVTTLETDISDIKTDVEDLNDTVSAISNNIANNYYTSTVTDEKIASAVAAAEHLSRKIVDKIEDIDLTGTSNTIYMVPTGLQEDDNKYEEYMVINGALEQLGTWEVDLSSYAKTVDVNAALDKKVTIVEGSRLMTNEEGIKLLNIEVGAQKNVIQSVSDSFNIDNQGQLTIVSVPNNISLNDNISIQALNKALENKVDIVSGKSLVDNNEILKLLGIESEAEKNKIDSVTAELNIDSNRVLSIVSVDGTKIVLENNETFKTTQSAIAALNSAIEELQGTNSDFDSRVSALEEILTWQTLSEE